MSRWAGAIRLIVKADITNVDAKFNHIGSHHSFNNIEWDDTCWDMIQWWACCWYGLSWCYKDQQFLFLYSWFMHFLQNFLTCSIVILMLLQTIMKKVFIDILITVLCICLPLHVQWDIQEHISVKWKGPWCAAECQNHVISNGSNCSWKAWLVCDKFWDRLLCNNVWSMLLTVWCILLVNQVQSWIF